MYNYYRIYNFLISSQLNRLGGLSSTPQVLSLTPHVSEFQAEVKKSPRVSHVQRTGQKGLARFSQGNGALVSRWDKGSAVFSKVFSTTAMLEGGQVSLSSSLP
jgi:hypothetical protein